MKKTLFYAAIVLPLFIMVDSRAERIPFVVAEYETPQHGDSYLVRIDDRDSATLQHARDIVDWFQAGAVPEDNPGALIVLTDIERGFHGWNRDYVDPGRQPWRWHPTGDVSFVDVTVEILDGWPTLVESDVQGWIDNTGGSIGFWNYTVIEELVSLACDFNGDFFCTRPDMDLLSAEIYERRGMAPSDPQFDLTGDGIVDLADQNEFLSLAAIDNGFAEPYSIGDAHLDGFVNAADLMQLALNWQIGDRVGWTGADFNLDSEVNAMDLNLLALNWQKELPRRTAAAVTEPTNWLLAVCAAWMMWSLARRFLWAA